MSRIELDKEVLRQMLKEVLTEAIQDQRGLLHDVFAEVLEEIGLAKAIDEGLTSEMTTRQEVTSILDEQSA